MQQEQKDRAEIRKIVQAVLEEDRKIQRGRILYNTRILMEQYIEMRRFVETAVSEVEDMEAYTQYASLISEDTHLESVRRTKLKTAMMIVNIDRALEELRSEYQDRSMSCKFDALRLHYVEGKSYEEIAELQNCGKNTPARWCKELIRKMSVKLFGIEGISW